MAASVANVKLGVCSVTFNGVDIGHTQGGVELKYEPTWREVMVDLYGKTVVDKRLVAEKLTAKVPFAEYTMANLQVAMPLATNVAGPPQLEKFGSQSGKSLLALAAALVLHPINATGTTEDVTIFKAVSSDPVMLPYKFDNERVFDVLFFALLDESKSNGSYLFQIGG